MPIVKPRLNSESLNAAVSAAHTRSGPAPQFVAGTPRVGGGAGWTGGANWLFNNDHFAPNPGQLQVDGYKSRLTDVERVYLSDLDDGGNSQTLNLFEIGVGQTITIDGVAGTVAAVSEWQWPKTQLWREENAYTIITLADRIDLSGLEDQTVYAVAFS